MLRIILSVAGVGLIALGLFGGRLFNQANEDQPVQATLEQIEVPAVSDTAALSSSVVAVGDDIAAVAPTESVAAVNTQLPTAEVSTVIPKLTEDPVVDNGPSDVVPSATIVNANLSSGLDLEKSSDRNEQVALAETILATAGVPAVEVAIPAIDKSVELDGVLEVSTGQLDSEMLVVMKDKVNMRDGPSIDHPVVLQLAQGQELMEFKREGKWVHVGAYGTSGKIGWVHERLVGPHQK